jgi:predicted transcriptional regulator
MISYYEITAHACRSVHVPGVAWPEYVESNQLKRRSQDKVKTQILDLLKYGAALTTQEILDEIRGPLTTIQANLYSMRILGEIQAAKRKLPLGKPINVYSLNAEKCLH